MFRTLKQIVMLVLVTSLIASSYMSVNAQSKPEGEQAIEINRQCGKQLSDSPISGSLWMYQFPRDNGSGNSETEALTLNTPKITAKSIPNDTSTFVYIQNHNISHATPSDNDALYIVGGPQNNMGSRYLQILNGTESSPILLPIDESQYNWDTIGSESKNERGHFAVLAHNKDRSAVLLDMTWDATKLLVKPIANLLFSIPVPPYNSPNKWRAEISPDWNVVVYSDPHVDYSMKFYSVSRQKVIASFPFITFVMPGVIWLRNNEDIALIVPFGADAGAIYRVDQAGMIRKAIDISAALGGKSINVGAVSNVSSNDQMLLSVAILDNGVATTPYHYILLDLTTYKLTDLCLTGDGQYLHPDSSSWSDDGKYVTVIEGLNTQKSRLLMLDATTGDYYYATFSDPTASPLSAIQLANQLVTPQPTATQPSATATPNGASVPGSNQIGG